MLADNKQSDSGERPHLRHTGSELGAFFYFCEGGWMMAHVRRTEDGFEITPRMIGAIVGLITIAGFFVTITAAAVGARQQLADATPVTRHDSLVDAVRRQREELGAIARAIDTLRRDVLGVTCNQARYPSPFCDEVARVLPAGRPR